MEDTERDAAIRDPLLSCTNFASTGGKRRKADVSRYERWKEVLGPRQAAPCKGFLCRMLWIECPCIGHKRAHSEMHF